MPRAIWTGSISFGLVNIPARIFSAVHEHKLHFHLAHAKDDGPIGYQKICKLEDRPVPDEEIIKVFEFEKGEFVQMTDEDFEAAQVEGGHTIDLEDFVPYDQIDPTFFAHTYLVGPQDGAERPYALLVRAMEETGLAGIGKFVMRSRQYVGCLRVRNGALTLEQMYFADEVDAPESVLPDKSAKVDRRELEMATTLIHDFSGDWEPTKYEDTYREALCEVIRQKRKGEDVHVRPQVEEEAPPDLMTALRQSLERSRGGRAGSRGNGGAKRSRGNGGSRRGDLTGLSKSELDERARKLEIPGRSKMTKDELAKAIAKRS